MHKLSLAILTGACVVTITNNIYYEVFWYLEGGAFYFSPILMMSALFFTIYGFVILIMAPIVAVIASRTPKPPVTAFVLGLAIVVFLAIRQNYPRHQMPLMGLPARIDGPGPTLSEWRSAGLLMLMQIVVGVVTTLAIIWVAYRPRYIPRTS